MIFQSVAKKQSSETSLVSFPWSDENRDISTMVWPWPTTPVSSGTPVTSRTESIDASANELYLLLYESMEYAVDRAKNCYPQQTHFIADENILIGHNAP